MRAHDGRPRGRRASSCSRRWLSTSPPPSSLCQVPSAPSIQARVSSASSMSMISSSWARRSGSVDRRQRLDPAVEVAGHEVGRADVVDRAAVGPRRGRTGRCGRARGSGRRSTAPGCCRTGRARPGRRQQMPRTMRSICTPGLRRPVEQLDQLGVDQAVHLERQPAVAVGLHLVLDQRGEPRPQVVRGDEQLLVARRRGRSR